MGSTPDSWRVADARVYGLAGHRIALYATGQRAAGTIVAHFHPQSSHGVRSPRACEERSRGADGLDIESNWTQLKRSGAAEITAGCIGLWRGLAQQRTLNEARTSQRSAYCDRGVTRRLAAVSGGSRTSLHKRSTPAFPIRSPPRQTCGRDCGGFWPNSRRRVSTQSHRNSSRRFALEATKRDRSASPRLPPRGSGFEEPQQQPP